MTLTVTVVMLSAVPALLYRTKPVAMMMMLVVLRISSSAPPERTRRRRREKSDSESAFLSMRKVLDDFEKKRDEYFGELRERVVVQRQTQVL